MKNIPYYPYLESRWGQNNDGRWRPRTTGFPDRYSAPLEPLRFGEDNPTANLFADVSNILAPDLGSRVPAAAPCKVDSRRSGTLRLLPVPSHGSILISCLAPILCESIHGSAVPSRRYLRSTSSGGFLASA
ncbi:hypothetical protein VTN96DRAFT_7832 [Rasamsonia emersonii]